MGRRLVLGFLLVAAGMPALTLPAWSDDPLPHFERQGVDLICYGENGKAAPSEEPCLAIGPLAIGMKRTQIEFRVGKPVQDNRQNGIDFVGYALGWSGQAQNFNDDRRVTTAAVVAYGPEGTADNIQVSGQPWDGAWRFCGLTLGDAADAVKSRLGEPLRIADGGDGAKTWSYGGDVSVDIRENRIVGIHLAKLAF